MQNKCITIIVGTANRPLYLREALASIRAQTALKNVAEVIVSENGENRASAEVVREFPELPIRYIYRDPPTPPLEHGTFLFEQPLNEYTAVLHDDDWWMPQHLANGLQALQFDRTTAAYYSSFYEVSDTAGVLNSGTWHFQWCFGTNFPRSDKLWELTLPEMAAASFLATPGHYSSLMAPSRKIQNAYKMVSATGNRSDNDRMITVALATQGNVIYQPLAEVFIRRHVSQDQNNNDWETLTRYAISSTDWIEDKCKSEGTDLQSFIANRILACPQEARPRLKMFLSYPWCVPLGRKIAARFPETATLVPDSWRSNWSTKGKNILRPLLPPIIKMAAAKWVKKSVKPVSP